MWAFISAVDGRATQQPLAAAASQNTFSSSQLRGADESPTSRRWRVVADKTRRVVARPPIVFEEREVHEPRRSSPGPPPRWPPDMPVWSPGPPRPRRPQRPQTPTPTPTRGMKPFLAVNDVCYLSDLMKLFDGISYWIWSDLMFVVLSLLND